ncbi:MAG: hypothetical protein KIT09_16425 [Bryobacteraceae bacterium]|nr:hypothetical protein [Bryobacteraceae bacterium]
MIEQADAAQPRTVIGATRDERTAGVSWASRTAGISMGLLLFEAITGLAVSFAPFHAAVQWGLLLHTVGGTAALLPLAWYATAHWAGYRRQALSDVVLLGYVAVVALFVCSLSGVIVTWQGLLALRTSPFWRTTHLISTLLLLAAVVPHLVLALLRARWVLIRPAVRVYTRRSLVLAGIGVCLATGFGLVHPGTRYVNEFPEDYNFLYGEDRPFAPSLARTSTGGAFDARSLAGSASCGTVGCHEQIVQEWLPSAHRYAAMDPLFQGIQQVMAEQNGPESTRYCGGCHDPVSLFSGTKNIFVADLTALEGYNEGVSCLACHSIQKTDVQGNANFVVSQPREYLWQWKSTGAGRIARDFLIRTYPAEHNRLSKRMFKAPEYCAACHKQFIDQEVNRVGWVQLQNQYDNWAASRWNQEGNARKTIECRECHMPLVDSKDPAAGDSSDYNRRPNDGKHRSHRFLAANNLMPALLKLEGAETHTRLTEHWLQGGYVIPEIRDKWPDGPIVRLTIQAPRKVSSGSKIPLRVILTSNKVGHDFPTGPLDMIQSWVELRVTDDGGKVIFASGQRDERNFIEPGTFLFKAEPVDQYGNLIDRHNLWEMVGVRYRRSLFPGYSDTAEYEVPGGLARRYFVTAKLLYRKVDQFLLNYVLGQDSGITAPIVEISRATATVEIEPAGREHGLHSDKNEP